MLSPFLSSFIFKFSRLCTCMRPQGAYCENRTVAMCFANERTAKVTKARGRVMLWRMSSHCEWSIWRCFFHRFGIHFNMLLFQTVCSFGNAEKQGRICSAEFAPSRLIIRARPSLHVHHLIPAHLFHFTLPVNELIYSVDLGGLKMITAHISLAFLHQRVASGNFPLGDCPFFWIVRCLCALNFCYIDNMCGVLGNGSFGALFYPETNLLVHNSK